MQEFDVMKANEEYEREWYEHCKGSGAWRPIRQDLHGLWASKDDTVYRLQNHVDWLLKLCIAEGAAIAVLFYLVLR